MNFHLVYTIGTYNDIVLTNYLIMRQQKNSIERTFVVEGHSGLADSKVIKIINEFLIIQLIYYI